MKNLKIENGKVLFPNFSGKPDGYSKNGGERKFNISIESAEFAEQLISDGWNIKKWVNNEDPNDIRYSMKVKIGYKVRQPKVVMVTNKKKVELTEDTIDILDQVEIECADVVINPYNWEVNGRSGVTAYLKTGYFIIQEDDFANKYRDEDNEMPEPNYKEDLPFDD